MFFFGSRVRAKLLLLLKVPALLAGEFFGTAVVGSDCDLTW